MSIALKIVKVITIQIAVIKKCFVILSSISFTFLFWKGVSIDNNKYVYCVVYMSIVLKMNYNSSYNTQMYELSLDCKTRNILFRLSYYTYSTYKDRNYRQNKNNKSIERSKFTIYILFLIIQCNVSYSSRLFYHICLFYFISHDHLHKIVYDTGTLCKGQLVNYFFQIGFVFARWWVSFLLQLST